jgi:hypothetical protein
LDEDGALPFGDEHPPKKNAKRAAAAVTADNMTRLLHCLKWKNK